LDFFIISIDHDRNVPEYDGWMRSDVQGILGGFGYFITKPIDKGPGFTFQGNAKFGLKGKSATYGEIDDGSRFSQGKNGDDGNTIVGNQGRRAKLHFFLGAIGTCFRIADLTEKKEADKTDDF
jgi:hypothetical protein